jgi:hypothetical protein
VYVSVSIPSSPILIVMLKPLVFSSDNIYFCPPGINP